MRARLPAAAGFPFRAVGLSVGLFGLLRSAWVEGHLVLPLTRFQQTAAEFLAGKPRAPINVTAECSGADVLALCLAAILAWPSSWRARLSGALGGIALILTLNTIRIGTLGQAAQDPVFFATLHLQIWPAILVVATSLYVFLWMRGAPRASSSGHNEDPSGPPLSSPRGRRFAVLATLFLVAFAFSGPRIAQSEILLAAGAWSAGEAALLLGVFGVAAGVWGNVLVTNQGAFMVTPECLATALVPVYFAAILVAPLGWFRRLLAIAIAPVLFAGLSIARLLLLALPPVVVASPLVVVHGFHQLVLAILLVTFFAWRLSVARASAPRGTASRTLTGLVAGFLCAALVGAHLTSAVMAAARAMAPSAAQAFTEIRDLDHIQGALATVVTFQSSFLLALLMAIAATRRQMLTAFGSLFAVQVLFVLAIGGIAGGSTEPPHALLLRAWAIGVPVVLILALTTSASPGPLPHTLVSAHDSP